MQWQQLDLDGPVGVTPVAGRVPAADRDVVVMRTEDGVLHATDRGCPHLGHPLTMGHVDGDVLECDHHAYRYSLTDGVCTSPGGPLAGRLALHEVREVADGLEVRLATDG